MLNKKIPFLVILIATVFLFKAFFFLKLIPLPADALVGMYHPYRDYFAKDYPRGIPYKNSLITDPVRQQYPWKYLSIENWKQKKIPYWNPYSFSGTPLLANIQSGAFYPLNIIFFLFPFATAWGFYLYVQFLLGGWFMFLYLNNLKIRQEASLIGSLAFIFSGAFITWGWWGNIIHTLLWLPLLLLCVDKVIYYINTEKSKILNLESLLWSIIFIISLCSSFFAGHLQVFFYLFLILIAYIFVTLITLKSAVIKNLIYFFLLISIFAFLTSVQWLPSLIFLNQTARLIEPQNWLQQGWFLPWQNLLQFIAPDFFGNPASGNYWGIWNYGEFIGYIGILPLIFIFYAFVFRKDNKVFFFGTIFFLLLMFLLPTPLAKIPYQNNLPFLSSLQPTRLVIVLDFVLVVLSSLGLDLYLKEKKIRHLLIILLPFLILFLILWFLILFGSNWLSIYGNLENLQVSKRNLFLPSLLFLFFSGILYVNLLITKKSLNIFLFSFIILPVVLFDGLRFADKFLPFTKKEYIYPQTKAIKFLKDRQKEGRFRIMAVDERIFPPNFSIMYGLETIDGYDPLYLKSYADLINKMENRESGSSFNRIITPKNYESPIADLLNVRYILSLTDLNSPKVKKVFQEGETRIYENLKFIKEPYYQNIIRINCQINCLI